MVPIKCWALYRELRREVGTVHLLTESIVWGRFSPMHTHSVNSSQILLLREPRGVTIAQTLGSQSRFLRGGDPQAKNPRKNKNQPCELGTNLIFQLPKMIELKGI